MKKEDIFRLASLSRIRISDNEVETLSEDIDAVLEYVSVVNDITAESELTKKVGPVHNIFREDEATCEPNSFTEALLAQAPKTEGRFLKVKKILQQD